MKGQASESKVPENGSAMVVVDESDTSLEPIRGEGQNVHAVAARTHNAVVTLAASVRDVVERQQRLERGLNLNSFVAYVLFTLLLGGAFFLLYRTRAADLVKERNSAVQAKDAAEREAGDLRARILEREQTEKEAEAFLTLLERGQREEAIASYAEIRQKPLSPVEAKFFAERVEQARDQVVGMGLREGQAAFEAGQWKKASDALTRALSYEEDTPRAADMRYLLGVSLHQQGSYAESARQLELAISKGVERGAGDDARFYLAASLEKLKQLERAREEYEKFATAHPKHRLYWPAKKRIFEIGKRLRGMEGPPDAVGTGAGQ